MSQKSPNQLDAGMTLTADVINLDGKILYKTGMSLTQRHIEVLLMWGISKVEVEGADNSESLPDLQRYDSKFIETAKAKTDQHFQLVKSSHPAVDTIQAMSVLKLAKKLQEANTPQ